MKKDITTIEDIQLMVNEFYSKVRKDDLLSPIFYDKIKDEWEPHLQRMYSFWGAALLGIKGYIGNPFIKHATLPIHKEHFEKWLCLFYETVDVYFDGEIASEAKKRASIMAENILRRLNDMRFSNTIPIV